MFNSPRMPSPLAGLKEVPGRLVIAKWGRNESANGSFTVGAKTARILPVLQKLIGFDTVAIDFEHNTLPGTEAYKADKEPRNVAANSPLSVIEGVGIVAHSPAWTPAGIKSVTEQLHPDISPVIKTDDAGEVVFVHSAALCRQGAVGDLKVFSVADVFNTAQLAAFSAATAAPVKTTSAMDYKKLVILLLGLDANSSDTDIEAACTKFAESVKGVGDLKAYAALVTKFAERLAALEKADIARERHALVSQAVAVGKVVPHGAEIDKLDNASFKAVLDSLEAGVVPLAQRTPEGLKAFSVSVITSNDAGSADVRKALGISEATWKKHNS